MTTVAVKGVFAKVNETKRRDGLMARCKSEAVKRERKGKTGRGCDIRLLNIETVVDRLLRGAATRSSSSELQILPPPPPPLLPVSACPGPLPPPLPLLQPLEAITTAATLLSSASFLPPTKRMKTQQRQSIPKICLCLPVYLF